MTDPTITVAHDTLRFTVPTTEPFNFLVALEYLRTSPSVIVERIGADSYLRPVRLLDQEALAEVRANHAGGGLDVSVRGASLRAAHQDEAAQLVRRVFATDVEIADLEQISDPVFAPFVQRYRGVRPVQIPDIFEAIVWAIIGQQINVIFAAKCKRALVDRFGGTLVVDGEAFRTFPTPEQVLAISEDDLRSIQFSRQKIRYTLALAREVVEGRLDLVALAAMPPDEAQARLEQLMGIGRWTAEYVLMRALGHRDVIPAADGGLRRAIGFAYGLNRLASETEVRQIAEAWAPWRSYAAFYWWFTLQEEAQAKRQAREAAATASARTGRRPPPRAAAGQAV
jgi:DNA-3-methyladenine glycosylase II